ncbi:MAG: sodium-dependent transporter [Lachnospiraceae bacterium]|nr:sodium-dependent transporter [Lachnospiraceae bacterium]
MKESTNTGKRENWSSRFGFIMAATGVAVGIGNIQRFPYLVGENGGAAFVVAYLIIMMFLAIPMTMLEIGIGQMTRKGTMDTYIACLKNKKVGTGLGAYITLVPVGLNMYYLIVIAWALFYFGSSVLGGWVGTDTQAYYNTISLNKPLIWGLFAVVTLVTCVIVLKGIVSGIDRACRIMIPCIFVILAILLIRSMTLDGFGEGLAFYMDPDWSKLLDWKVWLAAASQSLFSIGIGPGMMIAYGSHLREDDDVVLNSMTICFLDTAVAMLAGLAIIPATIALGFDPASGPSLIYVVLPALFDQIFGGRVLAVLFFAAVVFAGLSSSISHLETPVSSFMDHFHWSRTRAVLIFGLITFAGGTICVFFDEIYNVVSTYAGDYFYGLSSLISVIVFGWIFGANRIKENFNKHSDIKMGNYYSLLLKVIGTPVLALVVLDLFI